MFAFNRLIKELANVLRQNLFRRRNIFDHNGSGRIRIGISLEEFFNPCEMARNPVS